jgi:hypothetical protein
MAIIFNKTLDLEYKHHNCGMDFTPAKVAEVLGYGKSWVGNLTVSITPMYIVVRGWSDTTGDAFSVAAPFGKWTEQTAWEPVGKDPLPYEMRFAPEYRGVRPGAYPNEEAEKLWSKARYFQLELIESQNIFIKRK